MVALLKKVPHKCGNRYIRPLAKKGLIPPTPLKKGGFKECCKRSIDDVEPMLNGSFRN
jgi:hypothetical protein